MHAAGESHFGQRLIERISDSGGKVDESQVWSIACSGEEDTTGSPRTFLSSAGGLFVYDGARLELHPGPSNLEIRHIEYDPATHRVYSAGNTGFGWWEGDEFGRMVYHPVETADHGSLNQDFWRVHAAADGKVYYQGSARICILTPETGEVCTVVPSSQFRYMHCLDGEVYVQDGNQLCRILDCCRLVPVCRADDRIMNIVRCGTRCIAALEHTGLMEFLPSGGLVPMDAESNRRLASAKILSIAGYDEGHLIVGTTQSGFFITDSLGRICPLQGGVRQEGHATVLSLARDANGDVWVGMEAGVARIDNSSRAYYLQDDRLGRVRALVQLGDRLVAGSNKGAFLYEDGAFRPIAGTNGSVWNISRIDGAAFIAHDQGLFLFRDGDGAEPVYSGTGVLSIVQSRKDPSVFVCGTYNGLALFRSQGGKPVFVSAISNYDGFCRDMHFDPADRLWIRDGHKGFIRLTLNEDRTAVAERKDYDIYRQDGDRIFALELDGRLLLCRNQQTWQVDPASGDLLPSPEGDLALLEFEKKYGRLERVTGSATGPFVLDDGGCATGMLNRIRINYGPREIRQSLYIARVELLGTRKRSLLNLGNDRERIPFDMNTVRIFVGGNANGEAMEYRMDRADAWSEGRLRSPLQLSSLSFGNHDIKFRLPDAPEVSCSIRLHINRPWYLTGWAILAYALAVFLIASAIVSYLSWQARKEQERKNLRSELKDRGKELANITFNNARRNSQLNDIKNLLMSGEALHRPSEVAKVSRDTVALINSYLEDESDWEKSEEYFNIIYDGLLEKLKKAHPELSKTDLKICVYVKLNLSTKEMADLMNISPRSVEMARYRLRKRLGLPAGEDIASLLAPYNTED